MKITLFGSNLVALDLLEKFQDIGALVVLFVGKKMDPALTKNNTVNKLLEEQLVRLGKINQVSKLNLLKGEKPRVSIPNV